ncbi:hypothetical protein MMC11_004199 [Xylographa trunciseda]|nr:hypothetical protein [Xylographa trunciseda]
MVYACPVTHTGGSHCILDCPEFGSMGYQSCLEQHHHDTACSDECLARVSENADNTQAHTEWQAVLLVLDEANAALERAEGQARIALRMGERVREALETVLRTVQHQREAAKDEAFARETWEQVREARRIRRAQVKFDYRL